MKNRLVWICIGVLCAGAWADDVYREFTNAEGRTFLGRVLTFDARKGVVQIEAENKKRAKIPLAALSEQDQVYVQEWDAAQGFLNERMFRVSIDDKQIDESKEEVRKTVSMGSSGGTTERLMNTIYREKIAYELELKNTSPATLSGIRIEYRIYYEQSTTSSSGRKPVPEQRVYNGNMNVTDIAAGAELTLVTEPVAIFKDEINPLDRGT